jgi:hypothetical protein
VMYVGQDSVAASQQAEPARAASTMATRSSEAPDAPPGADTFAKILIALGVLCLVGAAALYLL